MAVVSYDMPIRTLGCWKYITFFLLKTNESIIGIVELCDIILYLTVVFYDWTIYP